MELEWLWQGVVGDLLAAALIGVGGAVLAYLQNRNSRLATPILYGLGGSTSIAVILFAFTGFITLPKQAPQTTLETVETNIRT